MANKAKVGITLSLEGEREYTAAIKNINSAQKELRSEMKTLEQTFKANANGIDALQSKHELLSKQYSQQADKVKVYETAVENCAKSLFLRYNRTNVWQ